MSELHDKDGHVIWTPQLGFAYATEFNYNGWQIRQGHECANRGNWTVEDGDGFLLTLDAVWVRRDTLFPSRATDRASVSFSGPLAALQAAHEAYQHEVTARAHRASKEWLAGLGGKSTTDL